MFELLPMLEVLDGLDKDNKEKLSSEDESDEIEEERIKNKFKNSKSILKNNNERPHHQ